MNLNIILFIFLIVVFVVFSLFSARARNKKMNLLFNKMAPGVKVRTLSGVCGIIRAISEDKQYVTLEIADGVLTEWLKTSVAVVLDDNKIGTTDSNTINSDNAISNEVKEETSIENKEEKQDKDEISKDTESDLTSKIDTKEEIKNN